MHDLDYDLDELIGRLPPIVPIPFPRPPVDEEPDHEPAARPDLHSDRIRRQMGWVRNEARMRVCPVEGCLARPGADCTVPGTDRRMRGTHPSR